ncbi:SDR family NAD(P)-dependent oxidoreductase [Actinopolyspora mortivallis]|uniref:3-oxoacyl-ACP reductase n=1 Tax=Actinopolyspora mortivallis TaxID=33906 RepID=A0A2T0GW29_ACTMO|nr:SDR family oxidoreductase [Actinopolyspora mortivallis]PRW63321.1 3-oxoacyl-ACP reductase [Actinopolyspora mortivallis]
MSNEDFALHGNTALVTGGGRGIGLSLARALSEHGAHVVIGEIDRDTGESAAERVGGEFVPLDVTDSARVAEVVGEIVATHGSLDVSVHNAGMVRNENAEDTSDESWREVLRLNLDGVFYCCREVGRAMLERGRGSIINIASMSGMVSNHPQAQVAYNTSKAGVITMTRSLAGEWADRGVRVNAISPGYVGTDLLRGVRETRPEWYSAWLEQTPMGRVADPAELGPLAVYLASNASSFMTGSNVVIDGGFTAW